MRRREFVTWLSQKYSSSGGTAGSRLSNCERIEEVYGDLDLHYHEDRLQNLLSSLVYSTADERASRPNPSKIQINGDLRNGLATLRNAITLYREFRDGAAPAPTIERRSRQIHATSAWPEWPGPDDADLLRLAHLAAPYVRFLNPQIVRTVVDDNERRQAQWSAELTRRGIDPSLYVWPLSPCAFPGIRRHAGSTEIAQHRGRMEQSNAPENALRLDDNDYPKHLWSFVFRGKEFQKHGPLGYSLAHLADHKHHGNRGKDEFDSKGHVSAPTPLFGLYTSAANTVYLPNGLIRPTDFSFLLRNLLQRRAAQLYGDFCNLLRSPLSIRLIESPEWRLDQFAWADPVGTMDHLPAFMEFRSERMERLFAGFAPLHEVAAE